MRETDMDSPYALASNESAHYAFATNDADYETLKLGSVADGNYAMASNEEAGYQELKMLKSRNADYALASSESV